MLTRELLDAYLNTHYRVEHSAGPFTLQIGQQSHQLLELLQVTGQHSAVFITAWNPYSQPVSAEENTHAQWKLLNDLRGMGCMVIPGVGLDPSGQWLGEDSLLATGLSQAVSLNLGRKYSQNAVIWCGEDAIPQLLICL